MAHVIKIKPNIFKYIIIICGMTWISMLLFRISQRHITMHATQLTSNHHNHLQFMEIGQMLNFLKPGPGLCSQLLLKSDLEISKDMEEYNIAIGEQNQSAEFPVLQAVQWYLARFSFVKTICAKGFNRGLSTMLWLLANKNAHVYVFDIGMYSYSEPAANLLRDKYPYRFNITWGDSSKTLPNFIHKHPDIKCDFIIVNGGHSYAISKSDHKWFRRMANSKHIVLLDDHPNLRSTHDNAVGQAWAEQKKQGELMEFISCTLADLTSGFSIGQYLS